MYYKWVIMSKVSKRLYNFAGNPLHYAAKQLCSDMTILCKPYIVVKCSPGLHLNCFYHAC